MGLCRYWQLLFDKGYIDFRIMYFSLSTNFSALFICRQLTSPAPLLILVMTVSWQAASLNLCAVQLSCILLWLSNNRL